jgi:hypothetical protein
MCEKCKEFEEKLMLMKDLLDGYRWIYDRNLGVTSDPPEWIKEMIEESKKFENERKIAPLV